MNAIELTNDFHNTSAKVMVRWGQPLSPSQTTRVRNKLCGIRTCQCGGTLSERGDQGAGVYVSADSTGQPIILADTPQTTYAW